MYIIDDFILVFVKSCNIAVELKKMSCDLVLKIVYFCHLSYGFADLGKFVFSFDHLPYTLMTAAGLYARVDH